MYRYLFYVCNWFMMFYVWNCLYVLVFIDYGVLHIKIVTLLIRLIGQQCPKYLGETPDLRDIPQTSGFATTA